MSGTYKNELLTCEKEFVKYLKKDVTGKYCFSCHEVLALELVGDKVIPESVKFDFYSML